MTATRVSPESADNVNVSISSHDLRCPITGEPFDDPCMTTCGHLFERGSIQDWRNAGHNDCPTCRTPCQLLPTLPPIVKELIEQSKRTTAVSTQRPQQPYYAPQAVQPAAYEPQAVQSPYYVPQQRLFTLSGFREALQNSTRDLTFYFNQLEQSADLLNDCSTNSVSPLYILTSSQRGVSALRFNNDLCQQISAQGLNRIETTGLHKGTSPIYNLAQKMSNQNDSIALMTFQKVNVRDKITAQGFNAVIQEGTLKGTSPLYWFIYHEAGLRLLREDARLRQLISPDSLNCILSATGISPVYYLMRTRLGVEVLGSDEQLRSKISSHALNAIVTSGYDEGSCPLLFLTSTAAGKEILQKDHSLRNKITTQGLNAVAKNGYYAGTSALFWLTQSEMGRQLLLSDEVLRSKISSVELNSTPVDTERGKSPAYYLANTASGKQILSIDRELKAKVRLPIEDQLEDARRTAAVRYERERLESPNNRPAVSNIPKAPPLPCSKPPTRSGERSIPKSSPSTSNKPFVKPSTPTYTAPPPQPAAVPQPTYFDNDMNSMWHHYHADNAPDKKQHHIKDKIKGGFRSIFRR